jgi:hypothetical protein
MEEEPDVEAPLLQKLAIGVQFANAVADSVQEEIDPEMEQQREESRSRYKSSVSNPKDELRQGCHGSGWTSPRRRRSSGRASSSPCSRFSSPSSTSHLSRATPAT